MTNVECFFFLKMFLWREIPHNLYWITSLHCLSLHYEHIQTDICSLSLSYIYAHIWASSLTSSSFRFLLSQMTIMMKPEEKKEKKNNTHDLCVFVWCCVFLFICFRVLHRFHWRKKYTMKLPSNEFVSASTLKKNPYNDIRSQSSIWTVNTQCV